MQLRFAISSHAGFCDHTLPVLLHSMTVISKIPVDDILVVVGGMPENQLIPRDDELELLHVTHNSFDYTALIEIIGQDKLDSHWFLLHDTCRTGPNFYHKALQFDNEVDYISAEPNGYQNMGVFHPRFLKKHSGHINNLRNCTKIQAIKGERKLQEISDWKPYNNHTPVKDLGLADVYSTGRMRRTLYFEHLDLYKYQNDYCDPTVRTRTDDNYWRKI